MEHPRSWGCALQKVGPALIARFRPAMIGCFAPVDRWAPSRLPVVTHRLMVYFKRAEFWHRTGAERSEAP